MHNWSRMKIVEQVSDEDAEFEDSDDEDETDVAKCIWKINPTESLYDLSLLRFLFLATTAPDDRPTWKIWRIFKVCVLLAFNGALQMTVVARVHVLVQNTRADRAGSVFLPTGNCHHQPSGLYSENPAVGLQEYNWDCGPMYPLLFANASFLDVNKDTFWSEADRPDELSKSYNAKFGKQGDLNRIFSEFLRDAKELKFETQINEKIGYEQSKTLTRDFTSIPMKWMVDQQPISSLCNNVDPKLCGNLEVRGILQDRFPDETDPSRRVRRCRQTWHWCVVHFGELFKNYKESAESVCDTVKPLWDPEAMVTINRYQRADKYSPKFDPEGILTSTYQSFLLLVLIIWWLTVMEECRVVLTWWMTILTISGGELSLTEDEEKIEVKAIPLKSKIFAVVLVLLPRTIIIIWLSFIGTDFLIIADSYGDLILNSVALGFLIEVDDMLFRGTASEADQEAIRKLQPIEGEHSCNQCFHDFVRWQTSIVLLIVVFVIPCVMAVLAYVKQYGKIDLSQAYECLCHIEGTDCIAAQLFGNDMEIPGHLLGVGGQGRVGKGR